MKDKLDKVRERIGKPTEEPAPQKPVEKLENIITEHGVARAQQRGISVQEVKSAIKSAERIGNVVSKVRKYGTPQKVYTGSNGVTVVVETSGRNAGKAITVWRVNKGIRS